MPAVIYWNASPEIVQLGPFAVRWYGVLFALGFYLGYLLVQWMFRIERKPAQALSDLLIWVIAASVVGARLVHCLFYEPGHYLAHPVDILKVWEGGLASHGGAAGVLIAIYAHSRRHKDQPFLWMLDRAAVPTALAASLIRTGNIFNSEILGRPTDVPWAFVFARVDAVPRHPAQLYEALAYLVIFIVLLRLYFGWRTDAPQGALTGWFLILIFAARFFIEFVKEPQATYENDFLITVGQWLSVPFILAGIVLIWRSSRLHPRPATPAPVKKAE